MKTSTTIALFSLLLTLIIGCGNETPTSAAAPDDGSGAVAKGMAALEVQDVRGAIAEFQKAASVCGTNFEARVQLALAHLRLGEVREAETAIVAAREICPESAEARLIDGQVAYLKKDYARALGDFAAVAGEKSLSATLRSEALAARGVVEMAQGENELARISLLRAMRLNRRNAAAWYHLGVLSRNSGFNEAALEQFDMAARFSDPREARTKRLSRDVIPALRGAIQKAAASKPGVAKRDPGAAAKLLGEGEALQKKKMIRAAIKKYEAAFAADPLSDVAAVKYAYLLALNDKSAAAVDKALAAYRAASEQRPERQSNYLAAARLAYANGRWATAAKIMNRAVAHDPENRQTLDLLIAALQKAGKGKLAEAWTAYRADVK
ncbi:MAG: tetratricopeptide repeat protein [Kiritimatiellia bacterium]